MITIIDYDAGNMKSVVKAFEYLGEDVQITRERSRILDASKVVLPGVGAFGDAMGMSPVTVSDKLNNKVAWTQGEIKKACDLLHIDCASIPLYFFTVKVKEL